MRTRSGGAHWIYRWHPGLPGNTAKRLAGVDTRGDGGYVVAWDPDALLDALRDPDTTEPPAALIAALAKPAPKANGSAYTHRPGDAGAWAEKALELEASAVAHAPPGQRNHTLNRAAFALAQIVAAGHLEHSRVESDLMAAAAACGLPPAEAACTLASGMAAGTASPRGPRADDGPRRSTVYSGADQRTQDEPTPEASPNGQDDLGGHPEDPGPGPEDVTAGPSGDVIGDVEEPVDLWGFFEPPTLPKGLLPPILERWATVQGELMGADSGGLALAALAAAAAAIPDSIKLQVKKFDEHWTESARLWVALVGDPSTKKSPIVWAAAAPIMRMDAQLVRGHATAMTAFNALPKDERIDPPKRARLRIDDATIEAAQDILMDNPEGLLCLQDELSGWIGGIDKYAGNRGGQKDRGFWLRTYNGGEYPCDRITRRSGLIENASINLLGGIQPAAIRALAADGVDDGLMQRMLFCLLRRASKGKDEPAPPVAREYRDMIEALNRLRPEPPSPFNHNEAPPLRFDQGAQEIRETLEQRHIDLMGLDTINRKLAAHIGKYDGLFARLCIVWHAVENFHSNPLPPTIAEATAERVRRFIQGYLLPHALAFYAGVLGLSDDHDRLTSVAGYILAHRREVISNRDVQRGDRTMRGLTRYETARIFEQLEALGWVRETPGTRPTDPPRWLVNPVCHDLYAERAQSEGERRRKAHAVVVALMKGTTDAG